MLLSDAEAAARWRASLPRDAKIGLVPHIACAAAIVASKASCDFTVIAVPADQACDAVPQDSEWVHHLRKPSDVAKELWVEGDGSVPATEALYLLSWIRPEVVFVGDKSAALPYERISKDFLFATTVSVVA